MNGMKVNLLQWSYPMFLWLIVALCTALACKNVIGSNEWKPAQPASFLSDQQTFGIRMEEPVDQAIWVSVASR